MEKRCRLGIRVGVVGGDGSGGDGDGDGGGGAAVVAFLRLLPTAQFPEIFPVPCVKSANSTSRFSDT